MLLYERVRPRTFDGVVGNQDTVGRLRAFVANGRTGAILLYGPPGTGKSTPALATARALGATDNTVDLWRWNVAALGADLLPQVRQFVEYGFFGSPVLILEEADTMPRKVQAALTTLLEGDLRGRAYILVTTDASRLSESLWSRCLCLPTNRLSDAEMMVLLNQAVATATLAVAPDTLSQIATVAKGSPRQALVLLENAAGGPSRGIGPFDDR